MRSASVGLLACAILQPVAMAEFPRVSAERGRVEHSAASLPALLAVRTNAFAWNPAREIRLPAFDASHFIAEDIRSADAIGAAPRVAAVRAMQGRPVEPALDGQWSVLADGSMVWRAQIQSPQALSVRLHFTMFELPEGAVLRVIGTDDSAVPRAYTGKGPLGDAEFWSHTFDGASVWLEYVAPAGVNDAPIIEIGELLHTYRDPASERQSGERAALALLPCEEDVNCHDVDPVIRDSVARISFISGGFSYLCSGGLIADVDPTTQIPWFVTANHCLSTEAEARTVEAFWFYESTRCDGPVPRVTTVPRTLGAALIYSTDRTDFTLLRLTEATTDGQTYAGWNTAPVTQGDMIGVHHPGGSHKRVSFSSIPETPFPGICITPNDFIYTRVNLGLTESGSSGSPLFNEDGEIVGQLLGGCGDPDCNYSINPDDIYGRFSVSYSIGGLDAYLNVIGGGDDDFEPNDFFNEARDVDFAEYELRSFDDDFYVIEVAETGRLKITAACNVNGLDVDLSLLTTEGAPVAIASTPSGIERLTFTTAPATYIVKVQRVTGGGLYRLNIELEPGLQSDLDDDGSIGPGDILRVLRQWGTFCPDLGDPTTCADLNNDATVGAPDLRIVLRDFGLRRTSDARAWKRQMKTLYSNDIAPLIDLPRNERNRAKKLDLQRLLNVSP